jgi:hypothetical protein
MRPKLKKRASRAEHEQQEVEAHRESIAEDERTHGEIRGMKRLIKKIAGKKRVS